ncbi:MAG: TatD family hydrolase [Spirochaetales bacterium]|nr:TatD family hydrolase [Spirochaetales bacterium]
MFSKICDAHFHLIPLLEKSKEEMNFLKSGKIRLCSCAHSVSEFLMQEKFSLEINEAEKNPERKKIIVQGFGLHPQMPVLENAVFLEKLLAEKRVSCIGETGFDFFTPEFKADEKRQTEAFEICLELGRKFNVPLIIHNRKALDKIFYFSSELKKLKALLFHGFPFSYEEASAVLKKGMNAYFSFGKSILRGNKKSISCVKNLPLENLLLETDSPFMTLKNQEYTVPLEVENVYSEALKLRNENSVMFEKAMENNFSNLYD